MKAPIHIGLIPDGNRRFARRLLQKPWKGHEWGIEKIRDVFHWAKDAGIRIITIYALSIENMEKRPKRELDFLFNLAKKEIRSIISGEDNFIHKNRVRVKFFGRLELLPKDLQMDIKALENQTREHSDYYINFAIAYGGRQEIVDTCRKIAYKVKAGSLKPDSIDETVIKANLYTNGLPDPDLIIRTSEQRLSGFLLWQSAYSELAFIDAYFPNITRRQFNTVINSYMKRERRMGR